MSRTVYNDIKPAQVTTGAKYYHGKEMVYSYRNTYNHDNILNTFMQLPQNVHLLQVHSSLPPLAVAAFGLLAESVPLPAIKDFVSKEKHNLFLAETTHNGGAKNTMFISQVWQDIHRSPPQIPALFAMGLLLEGQFKSLVAVDDTGLLRVRSLDALDAWVWREAIFGPSGKGHGHTVATNAKPLENYWAHGGAPTELSGSDLPLTRRGAVIQLFTTLPFFKVPTSGSHNDCLCHAFLTTASPGYRRLNDAGKAVVADAFRRRFLVRVLQDVFLPKYTAAAFPAFHATLEASLLELASENFLYTEVLRFIAEFFNVNILLRDRGAAWFHVVSDPKNDAYLHHPFVLLFNPGAGHYSAVGAKGLFNAVTNKPDESGKYSTDWKFIFERAELGTDWPLLTATTALERQELVDQLVQTELDELKHINKEIMAFSAQHKGKADKCPLMTQIVRAKADGVLWGVVDAKFDMTHGCTQLWAVDLRAMVLKEPGRFSTPALIWAHVLALRKITKKALYPAQGVVELSGGLKQYEIVEPLEEGAKTFQMLAATTTLAPHALHALAPHTKLAPTALHTLAPTALAPHSKLATKEFLKARRRARMLRLTQIQEEADLRNKAAAYRNSESEADWLSERRKKRMSRVNAILNLTSTGGRRLPKSQKRRNKVTTTQKKINKRRRPSSATTTVLAATYKRRRSAKQQRRHPKK